MKNIEDIRELHCPEVREIMDKSPSWIIRWGTLVITIILTGVAIVVWLKYF
jgi:hypothetical protein